MAAPGTVKVSDEQLAKLIDAYKAVQEFLASALSPNELYCEEFLAGLRFRRNAFGRIR